MLVQVVKPPGQDDSSQPQPQPQPQPKGEDGGGLIAEEGDEEHDHDDEHDADDEAYWSLPECEEGDDGFGWMGSDDLSLDSGDTGDEAGAPKGLIALEDEEPEDEVKAESGSIGKVDDKKGDGPSEGDKGSGHKDGSGGDGDGMKLHQIIQPQFTSRDDAQTSTVHKATPQSSSKGENEPSPTGRRSGDIDGESSGSEADKGSLSEEAKKWLELNNDARRRYGAGPLVWDAGLEGKAKRNAELCTGDHS